jgi:hypothetical protein
VRNGGIPSRYKLNQISSVHDIDPQLVEKIKWDGLTAKQAFRLARDKFFEQQENDTMQQAWDHSLSRWGKTMTKHIFKQSVTDYRIIARMEGL